MYNSVVSGYGNGMGWDVKSVFAPSINSIGKFVYHLYSLPQNNSDLSNEQNVRQYNCLFFTFIHIVSGH